MKYLIAAFVFLQATGLANASSAAQAPTAEVPGAIGPFDDLSQLVGTWKPAGETDSPLRIKFYLTARGTVLVESWEVRGRPHSLTIYHRDGPGLIATHYCPQGNQPRLFAFGNTERRLHFTFRDATDLDPATESYQHELWFDLSNPARPIRGEIYRSDKGPGSPEETALVRVDE